MKRHMAALLPILLVTLLLPWLAVTFLPGDVGMAASLMLFFAVNPLLAIGTGILAGWRRQGWWPAVMAAFFVLGAWLVFSPGEMAFVLYAGVYLALGLAAMALTWLIRKK